MQWFLSLSIFHFISFKITLILVFFYFKKKKWKYCFVAKFCAFPSPHWLQYNLLWELDSRLYHSQLIKMKVRYWEIGREEKVSLQNCLFENGVKIKSPASGSCIDVAPALFLTYSFQENAAKVTGVNLFIWNREKYLNDYKCSSVYIYQMILILCGLCFTFSWESSVHRLIYQDFSRMVPKCNGNQMEFWYLQALVLGGTMYMLK